MCGNVTLLFISHLSPCLLSLLLLYVSFFVVQICSFACVVIFFYHAQVILSLRFAPTLRDLLLFTYSRCHLLLSSCFTPTSIPVVFSPPFGWFLSSRRCRRSPHHLGGAVMLWEGGEKARENVWAGPCECVFSLLSVSAVCRWRLEQQPHLSCSSALLAAGWKALFFSIFASIPPANVKACLHQWQIQQKRQRTRKKKNLHSPGRRSVPAQRQRAHPLSLWCFSVWHSPPQSETATRVRVCRSSVRLPSLPPSASLSISPPSRSSSTQLAGCSSKNLPVNRRGEERNGKQRVEKNAGKRRDREKRRPRLVNGEKTRGQKDWESRKEEPEGSGEEWSVEARRQG